MEVLLLLRKAHFHTTKRHGSVLNCRIPAPISFRWTHTKLKDWPIKKITSGCKQQNTDFATAEPATLVEYPIKRPAESKQKPAKREREDFRPIGPLDFYITRTPGLKKPTKPPAKEWTKVVVEKKRKMDQEVPATAGSSKRPNDEEENFDASGVPTKRKKSNDEQEENDEKSMKLSAEVAYYAGMAKDYADIGENMWWFKPKTDAVVVECQFHETKNLINERVKENNRMVAATLDLISQEEERQNSARQRQHSARQRQVPREEQREGRGRAERGRGSEGNSNAPGTSAGYPG